MVELPRDSFASAVVAYSAIHTLSPVGAWRSSHDLKELGSDSVTLRKDLGGNGAINHGMSSKYTCINRLIASLQNNEEPQLYQKGTGAWPLLEIYRSSHNVSMQPSSQYDPAILS